MLRELNKTNFEERYNILKQNNIESIVLGNEMKRTEIFKVKHKVFMFQFENAECTETKEQGYPLKHNYFSCKHYIPIWLIE